MSSLLSFDNEVFANYIFYSGAVGLKMLAMSVWTAKRRMSLKVGNRPAIGLGCLDFNMVH